jgi:hypothetical protein
MILQEYHHRLPRWQDIEGTVEYLVKYDTIILARTDEACDLRKGLEQYVLLVDDADLPFAAKLYCSNEFIARGMPWERAGG